jgi:cytochrome c-type biogenesis protein CcsB
MMRRKLPIRVIDLMVVLAIVGYCGYKGINRPPKPEADVSSFANLVQLDPLYKTAVQADGRLRSFESHAKTYMGYITGPRAISRQSNGFTYFDLIFRPERYDDVDLIYVKNKRVREQIVTALEGQGDLGRKRAATIRKVGLVSRNLLAQPPIRALLQRLGQDLIRTAKQVDAIQSALAVSESRFLMEYLRMVAPPSGELSASWLSISRLTDASGLPGDDVHAGMGLARTIAGLDPDFQDEVAAVWSALRDAWRNEDPNAVNAQLTRFAALLPTISPQLYPSSGRLGMESWYFRYNSMTWVWLLYLAGVVPLLMSVIYKWDGARKVGMGLFVIAFAFHTVSLGIRWYISGRWPNSNMFEAVTTSAWFGGVGALILERLARRTVFRNLFALGSAVMSMTALMAVYFLPAQLDSGISNKMAALNDVWLYIHTNMIIWGYAVIGLACVPAMLQFRHRWCLAWDEETIPKLRLLILPIAIVVLNYSGYRLLMHVLDDPARELTGSAWIGMTGAFWGSLMIVLLEASAARTRRAAGAKVERAADGGAAALIMASPTRSSFLRAERPTPSQVYDGATMVLVELSFIMLWTGIVMGAIWADHSWGRPWGWDPKEVFALNTFIIFLILIHVRLKVRDKAFWTAVLAVVGFEVMMFNWIVVNFVITGLHSYA